MLPLTAYIAKGAMYAPPLEKRKTISAYIFQRGLRRHFSLEDRLHPCLKLTLDLPRLPTAESLCNQH